MRFIVQVLSAARDSALLFLVLTFSGIQDFFALWVLTCIVSFAGRFRLVVLAAANVLYIAASGSSLFAQAPFFNIAPILSTSLDTSAVRLLCTGLLIALSCFVIYLSRILQNRAVITTNLAVLLVLVLGSKLLPYDSLLTDTLRGTAMLYSKYFWAIAFSIVSFQKTGTKGWLLLTSLSYWAPGARFHIGAIPRGYGELVACERHSAQDLAQSRRSAIILVAIGSVMYSFSLNFPLVLDYLNYPIRSMPQMTSEFATSNVPIWLLWIHNSLNGLQYFLRGGGIVSTVVGLVRFAGFHIPLAQFKPWRAHSFSDLFRRIYFYYSETLLYFFYYPAWRYIRHLRISRNVQKNLTLIGSVVGGGLAIHLVYDVPYLLANSFDQYILLTASRVPYFIFLAVCAAMPWKPSRTQTQTTKHANSRPKRLLIAWSLFVLYLFGCGLLLPNSGQLLGQTTPSLDWNMLFGYVGKLIGF